jgi:hypothetical protein
MDREASRWQCGFRLPEADWRLNLDLSQGGYCQVYTLEGLLAWFRCGQFVKDHVVQTS